MKINYKKPYLSILIFDEDEDIMTTSAVHAQKTTASADAEVIEVKMSEILKLSQ